MKPNHDCSIEYPLIHINGNGEISFFFIHLVFIDQIALLSVEIYEMFLLKQFIKEVGL